jgi:hypothetical protein
MDFDLEIQWDNPGHFLLDRKGKTDPVTVEFFSVPSTPPEKLKTWWSSANQTPIQPKSRSQTSLGFELVTLADPPALVVSKVTVSFKDGQFSERLLVVQQLLVFTEGNAVGKRWVAAQWVPVLPLADEAASLEEAAPKAFTFERALMHPLISGFTETASKLTLKIATTYLDITDLWWHAVAANSGKDASMFTAKERVYLFDAYNRWYKDNIGQTECAVLALASTASTPPLIWFALVPSKLKLNSENETIFSQVYYRPAGWRPEHNWKKSASDIIGKDRVGNVLAMLLWCVMDAVKVLEESKINDHGLCAYISDRFKMLPGGYDANKPPQYKLDVGPGIWAPQRMASSTSAAGKPQIVYIPVRHDNVTSTTDTVDMAVRENLHQRLRVAANVLWSMGYVSTACLNLAYEDQFVVAGYSAGGFNMWAAAEKNLDNIKALIAIEPAGIPYPVSQLRKVVDRLVSLQRKVFFVGQHETKGDLGAIFTADGTKKGVTYLPPSGKTYGDFFAFKALTTSNEWIKYVFTGLKKRNDEKDARNAFNPEPHPEPEIPLDERKAINKLGITSDTGFGTYFTSGDWFGIPVMHLFAMCGGQVFTPAKLDSKGIVTADASYKTFYQECMEML